MATPWSGSTRRDPAPLTRSGDRPRPLSSLTLFWVGLVFCSPVVPGCTEEEKKTHPKTRF